MIDGLTRRLEALAGHLGDDRQGRRLGPVTRREAARDIRAAVSAMQGNTAVEQAVAKTFDMFAAALRGTADELRSDSSDVADAIIGLALSVEGNKAKMVRDVAAHFTLGRRAKPPT